MHMGYSFPMHQPKEGIEGRAPFALWILGDQTLREPERVGVGS